jgi:hypothetical protein
MHTFNRRRVYPTNLSGCQEAGTMRNGSRVHEQPIDQLGTQLCPGSIAMTTPQTFTMASPPTRQAGFGVDRPQQTAVHCTPTHIHQI